MTTELGFNLLTDPLIHIEPTGHVSLPGLLAGLARDEVDSYPCMRPHQSPAWHMFLVQLAALAQHRAGRSVIPVDEQGWLAALRGLTPDFPNDEPWSLIVADAGKPAFMQPPVPNGMDITEPVPTPDALDVLITARNHDLKQSMGAKSEPEDWIFSLVSLQTMEGFSGQKNYGIARMNGGSSSRAMLGLSPLQLGEGKDLCCRAGRWFRRDVEVLLTTREEQLAAWSHIGYPEADGVALTWIENWPDGKQIRLGDLDLWFIEVCRRIRLRSDNGRIIAQRGTSAKARIPADGLKGAVGDPWAPVHVGNKSLTLGEGDFTYSKLVELLLSGDWKIPLLARPAKFESDDATLLFVAQALSRGNGKTWGFKSRCLPVGGRIIRRISMERERESIHKIAQQMMQEIKDFAAALRESLALFAMGGNPDKRPKNRYECTKEARGDFDRAVNDLFFAHLWERVLAQDLGAEPADLARHQFLRALFDQACVIFEAALVSVLCPSLYRHRAEARAHRKFRSMLRSHFPELFARSIKENDNDATA